MPIIPLDSHIRKEQVKLCPHARGTYRIYDRDGLIYAGYSGDLRRQLRQFVKLSPHLPELSWFLQAISFEYTLFDDSWAMLLEHNQWAPRATCNHLWQPYNDYPYLAISYQEKPYLKTSDFTLEDRLYVGPFPSMILAYDIIDNLPFVSAELQMVPPDSNLDDLALEKWWELLFGVLLNPGSVVVETLRKKAEALSDELHFVRAFELESAAKIWQKYYQWLTIFITAKNVDYIWEEEGRTFVVKAGQLAEGGAVYRPQERLAYEKSHINEVRIVYKHIKKINPEYIRKCEEQAFAELGSDLTLALKGRIDATT